MRLMHVGCGPQAQRRLPRDHQPPRAAVPAGPRRDGEPYRGAPPRPSRGALHAARGAQQPGAVGPAEPPGGVPAEPCGAAEGRGRRRGGASGAGAAGRRGAGLPQRGAHGLDWGLQLPDRHDEVRTHAMARCACMPWCHSMGCKPTSALANTWQSTKAYGVQMVCRFGMWSRLLTASMSLHESAEYVQI